MELKAKKELKIKETLRLLKTHKVLYFMLLPALTYFIIFNIIPLMGMVLAFQDYRIIGKNQWAGLKHFQILFSSPAFFAVLKNTLIISLMKILICFPIPLILSLLVNEVRAVRFRKYVQSVIYLPDFLSWVVITGIWITLLSPKNGAVN